MSALCVDGFGVQRNVVAPGTKRPTYFVDTQLIVNLRQVTGHEQICTRF